MNYKTLSLYKFERLEILKYYFNTLFIFSQIRLILFLPLSSSKIGVLLSPQGYLIDGTHYDVSFSVLLMGPED